MTKSKKVKVKSTKLKNALAILKTMNDLEKKLQDLHSEEYKTSKKLEKSMNGLSDSDRVIFDKEYWA